MRIIYRTEDDRIPKEDRKIELKVPWDLHSGNISPPSILFYKGGITITYDCVEVQR